MMMNPRNMFHLMLALMPQRSLLFSSTLSILPKVRARTAGSTARPTTVSVLASSSSSLLYQIALIDSYQPGRSTATIPITVTTGSAVLDFHQPKHNANQTK
mmetsp:Transcript_23358/g.55381  ORF Transcript_23358/g.55381 Transcript_23358/m.55381 type:complete len:101 (-) Transcript_23358:72-374(-)